MPDSHLRNEGRGGKGVAWRLRIIPGENIGTTDTYVLFVELKGPPARDNS